MIPWRKFAFFISLVQRKFSEWKKGSSCESQGLSVWGRCNCINENQIDTNFPEEASPELTVWFPLITRSTGFVPQHRAWGQSLYADWWHCRRVGLMVYFCCYYCSVAKSCPTLCDPIDCSTPGSSVFHYLLEFAQICVHRVGDVI